MLPQSRPLVFCVSAALLLNSCGGGGTTNPPPPPPPPPPAPTTLAKLAGDNQSAIVGQAVAAAPSVKVTSASGAGVSGVVVTFTVASGGGSVTGGTPSTANDGVATVGGWTLGTGAGPNTLTATIAAAGVTGNPATFSAIGLLTSFNPISNTTLSGTHSFTTITIPAGVTVTMTGDLTLNATGAVTIAGNLAGDCVSLTINADGALTVSGNLNNGCSGAIPPAGPPVLTLVGKGGYTLNGPGAFTAGGDVVVTNDPALTDADFAPGAAPGVSQLRGKGVFPSVGEPCINNGYTGTANPATAANGADGSPNGTNGKDGSTWTLRCKGGSDIIISGSLSLTGQHGGRGGNGSHSSATAAVSSGGSGGKGGTVKIQALGSISIGASSTIRTGNGGAGGSATADGSSGHGGSVGGSGAATGGAGGSPGLFSATAKTGGISFNGSLNLQIGTGGRGGNATAIGGDGHDAQPCAPAVGGPAIATAGAGGSTPDKTLNAAGAVAGLGNVTVTGGTPGAGGDANATAGKGGAGAQPCKPGAIGGAPTAKGGKGGDADLKDQTGTKVANGGNGGSMAVSNGKGGQGWIDCILPTFEPGGAGGMGGSIAGFNGMFGTGLANGNPGPATYTTVANGGNGGDGQGPGAGGPAGGNGVALNGGVTPTIVAPSFLPGVPGNPCAGFTMLVTPPAQTVAQGASGSAHVVITRSGAFTGAIALEVKDDGGIVRGTGNIGSGSTQTDISFTVPPTAPTGNRTWTVTGTGTGVPIVTELLQLTLTGIGGTIDLVIQNTEQATRPWTKVLSRIGTGVWQSHSIAGDGTASVPIPGTPTPMEIDIQQSVGNDRYTYVYQARSDDFLTYGNLLGNKAKGSITTTVSGVPNNSLGVSYAGSVVTPWPGMNTSPFNLPQSRVETGLSLVGGCSLFGMTQEPQSTILGMATYLNGGTYACDFSGPGVKPYLPFATSVTGFSPGTPLTISGGYRFEDTETPLYAKAFIAPTTNYYAVSGMDLPAGVLQWENLARTTATTREETTYYFTNPLSWTTPLPAALTTPVVNINSIFNTYYEFNVILALQILYLGAFFTDYTQPNVFGGTNFVTHLALRSFFGTSLPSTFSLKTPATTLLDNAYMPKPPGLVSGNIYGLSYNPFQRPVLGNSRFRAGRVNVSF